MRVVVTADTHLGARPRPLPPALVEAATDADLILHAGDVVAGWVLDELAALAPLAGVLGNCDGWDLVERLPERIEIEAGPIRIGMIHDPTPERGRLERLRAAFPGCRVIVFGHTHLPVLQSHERVLLLNPGSPTQRRRSPYHSFALLDIDDEGELEARLVRL